MLPRRGGGRPKGGYRDTTGRVLPSVTTILRRWGDPEALIRWAMRMGQEAASVRDRSAAVGHAVHDAIEATVCGDDDPLAPLADLSEGLREEADMAYHAWSTWWTDTGSRWAWELVELPLIHEARGYAGTVDAVAIDEHGARLVVDWKTSKRTYTTHLYQCAAYADALEAQEGLEVDGCCVVRADKASGVPEVHTPPDAVWDATRSAWRRLLWLYQVDQRIHDALGLGRRDDGR